MTISFSLISPSVRASKTFIELAGVRRSLAGLFIPPTMGLIGQYDPAKTATVDYEPVKVLSADNVGNLAGFGSHAHRIALGLPPAVFLQGGGVYWFPVPAASGTVADIDLTVTGTASSGGTLFIQIGGVLLQVGVADGDDVTAVADSITAAVTASRDIAVTASNIAGVVTLEAKFLGTAGNQIEVILNPAGTVQEDQAPGTTAIAISEADGYMINGATDPSVESVFFDGSGNDKLGDRWYTVFNMPYTDQTNIDWHKASGEKRIDPAVNRFFASYGAYIIETYAAALALPDDTNSQWVGKIWEDRYQSPAFELSAELCGIILEEQNLAPNRPYKTLELDSPADAGTVNRRYVENDALFRIGMSYCNLNTAGSLQLGDIALTLRTDSFGGSTEEWFDAVGLHARQAKAYSIEQLFKGPDYARGVVTGDNDPPTKVPYAIAPKDIISAMTKLIFDLWVPNAWTKNPVAVVKGLTAEINAANNSRIDGQVTDDPAQALRIIAMKYAYLY